MLLDFKKKVGRDGGPPHGAGSKQDAMARLTLTDGLLALLAIVAAVREQVAPGPRWQIPGRLVGQPEGRQQQGRDWLTNCRHGGWGCMQELTWLERVVLRRPTVREALQKRIRYELRAVEKVRGGGRPSKGQPASQLATMRGADGWSVPVMGGLRSRRSWASWRETPGSCR